MSNNIVEELKGKMYDVYLSLGSNVGNKADNIKKAIACLSLRVGEVLSVSSMYQTEPVGFESDNLFMNAACFVRTRLNPLEVLAVTQAIELKLGRQTKSINQIYSDRTIDIDILLIDDITVEHPQLIIPHPRMHERNFVLDPLVEIAPDIVHPILGKTISELKLSID